MAVGKASLKRAAKAAETEVKTESLPVSEKEAPEKTETVTETAAKVQAAAEPEETKKTEPSEVKPKKSSTSRKTKATAETSAVAEKPKTTRKRKPAAARTAENKIAEAKADTTEKKSETKHIPFTKELPVYLL